MLILYDVNHNKLAPLPNAKSPKLERYLTGDEDLSFSYPQNDINYPLIQEECYVRTADNEYIVKEVDEGGDYWTDYVCKINVDELKGSTFDNFSTDGRTAASNVNLALAGTGWSIGSCDVTKLRSVSKQNSSVHDILTEIQTVYLCEMHFDAINKKVYIYQVMGGDKGAYFIDQLNLKQLEVQRNSYDFCTRLIPIGKDGLNITAVNGGKNYVENHQYSSKVFTAYWEDNRYTDAESLLEDAVLRLGELSKPTRAYTADVIDLASISSAKYSILDYSLGDTITLVDGTKKLKDKQRIVKTTEYLEEPEQNSVEIANRMASLELLQVHLVQSATTVDSITTTDGQLVGSKIDGVDYTQIKNVLVGTADIQDAAIVTAKIGDAQITTAKITDAAITSAQIANATITAAQIANATIGTAQIANGAITSALIGSLAVGTASIADAAITSAKIATAAIGSAQIGSAAIGTAQIQTGAITTALVANAAIGASQIADASITDAKVVSLSASKLSAGTIDAGVITVTNLNATNITAGSLNGLLLGDGTITSTKIADGTIQTGDIGSGQITNTLIAASTITGDRIVASTITGDKIAAATITANNLVAGTITAASGIIANAAIGTAQIADASITSAKIVSLDAGQITTGTLAGITITGSTITAKDSVSVLHTGVGLQSINLGDGSGGVDVAHIEYDTDQPANDVTLIFSAPNFEFDTWTSGHIILSTAELSLTGGLSAGGNVVAPAFDGMLRIPTLSTGAQLNDSVRLSVLYCGSSNGSFAGNFTANVQYPVHNGGTSPVYCAQTMSFTKPTRILITGICSFLASSTTFTGMTYIRISLRAGSSYAGATVIATGGAAGESLIANYGWHQIAFSTVLSVPAGVSTWWLEWWSNTGNPYQMTGNLWNITTLVLAQ